MAWRSREIVVSTPSGPREVFARSRKGVALVGIHDSSDEVAFFSVTHIRSGARIAKLFCSESRAPAIADKIVEMQDWTKVRCAEDVLPTTKDGLQALAEEHHLIV